MKKMILLTALFHFCIIACSPNIDEGPEVIAELVAKIPEDIASNRGECNCELFDLALKMIKSF